MGRVDSRPAPEPADGGNIPAEHDEEVGQDTPGGHNANLKSSMMLTQLYAN